MKNIDKSINEFNKAIQDFGDAMESITSEISKDVKKSNRDAEIREEKNRENLDKIWGRKKKSVLGDGEV